MTAHEAYAMGWVYGYLYQLILKKEEYDKSGKNFSDAAAHPLTGFATIHRRAMDLELLTSEVQSNIMKAVDQVEPFDEEGILPLPLQGSWQLGYYSAMRGNGVPVPENDLTAKRKAKGMTQQELARAMGVDQAVVSRWESGKATPSAANRAKIATLLEK